MKKSLLIACICVLMSYNSFSQTVYWADTAFTTDVGYAGAPASCMTPHTYYEGWKMSRQEGIWLADVFTVPAGSTWAIDTVIVYGYQKGSGTTSSFLNSNLEIYSGSPGLGGTVIWGDTSTNVLAGSGFTGIYRVDTFTSDGGLINNTRPIMYLKLLLSPAAHLGAGTYWLSWSAAGSVAISPASPDKVLPGRINPPGQTARQLYNGAWDYITDSSQTIGLDKIIEGSSAAIAALAVTDVNNPALGTLYQNAPNPFIGSTGISFNVLQSCHAKLSVYNAIGQLVTTLVDDDVNAGDHEVTFSADYLPPGVYLYQLKTNADIQTRQMVLSK